MLGEETIFDSIVFWNCHGITNFLSLDRDQQKICNNLSIICLSETWCLQPIINIPFLSKWTSYSIPAQKNKKYGRASGGICVLTNPNLACSILHAGNDFLFINVAFRIVTLNM